MLTQPQAQKPQNYFGELAEDQIRKFEQWRILHHSILTDREIHKMQKIHKIFASEVGGAIPIQLDLVDKEKDFFFKSFKFKEARLAVQESDFEAKVCISRMGEANGAFRFQAEEIVKICCQFQIIKKERHITSGFMTDPENLFCEEIKSFATSTFCNLEANEVNKGIILKRVRYLEEILCEDDLFDRPDSRITHTIQQVIVAVRGVLKYHTIPMIDKKLIHADAAGAFEEMMKHIIIIISDTSELLYHVFRGSPMKVSAIEHDQAMKILRGVLKCPDVSNAMMTHQSPVVQNDATDEFDHSKQFLDMRGNGKLYLHEYFVYPPEQQVKSDDLIELSSPTLQKIFLDEDSGLEARFRKNAEVAKQFLKAHYFLMSLGRLYTVIEKAKDCALTGGTLLVYGIANAQLNSLLELGDSLINSLNSTVSALMCIAETRFGELVYTNSATALRCPWIGHYKLLPSLLVKFEKRIKQLLNELAKMRTQANSMTLYEQFQKAQQETNVFLTAAHGFSEQMAEVLNIAYSKPVSKAVVNVPALSQIQNGLLDEVQGEFPAITNTTTAITTAMTTANTTSIPVPVSTTTTTATTTDTNTITSITVTSTDHSITETPPTTATTAMTTATTTANTTSPPNVSLHKKRKSEDPAIPKLLHRDSFEVTYIQPEEQFQRNWRTSNRRSLMLTGGRISTTTGNSSPMNNSPTYSTISSHRDSGISAATHRDFSSRDTNRRSLNSPTSSHQVFQSSASSSVASLIDGVIYMNNNSSNTSKPKRLVASKSSGGLAAKSATGKKSPGRTRTDMTTSGGGTISSNSSSNSSSTSTLSESKKVLLIPASLKSSAGTAGRTALSDDDDSDSEDSSNKTTRFSLTTRKTESPPKNRRQSSSKSSDDEDRDRDRSRNRRVSGSSPTEGDPLTRSGNRKLSRERSRSRSRGRESSAVSETKSVKMDDPTDGDGRPKSPSTAARRVKYNQ